MLLLFLSAVLVLVACGVVALGSVAVTRHRAGTAADLAALAAAGRAFEGSAAACSAAGRVVAAAHAELVTCTLIGGEAEVDVRLRPPGWLGRFGEAHGRARAGPAMSAGRPP